MMISRRTVLTSAAASVLVSAKPSRAEAPFSAQFLQAYETLLNGRKPVPGTIDITVPQLAEDGSTVGFLIAAKSPMTDQDHVTTLSLLSTGNPQPVIATFHFTPLSGRAAVSGRLRLARTQDVVVVAQTNRGALFVGAANVEVTVGGCGGG